MSFYEAVIDIIGTPPVGYEALAYVITAIFALFVLVNAFMVIGAIIKKVGDL